MRAKARVAVTQLQWKWHQDEQTLRDEIARFLRLARDKRADLVLLPESTGLLLAGPLAHERQELQKEESLLDRLLHLRGEAPGQEEWLAELIQKHGDELVERYQQFFRALARDYGIMIVAGTLPVPDAAGILRHQAAVFDTDGRLLGWQSKLHLTEEERALTEPGENLQTFEGEFGRFGILIGHDLLFPELARALAYRGCVAILHPTLALNGHSWQRQRIVAAARAQENQLFVAQSFCVGTSNALTGQPLSLVGKSALFVPLELSPHGDGLLGEVGAEQVAGLVSGDWDVAGLHQLWKGADVPVREMGRGLLFHDLLAFDYNSGATIAERTSDVEEVAELNPATLPLAPSPAELPLPEPTESEVASPAQEEEQAPTGRWEPIIDPDTGLYLGERQR